MPPVVRVFGRTPPLFYLRLGPLNALPCTLHHLPIVVMVLLMAPRLCRPIRVSNNGPEFGPVHLHVTPPEITSMFTHDFADIHINCSSSTMPNPEEGDNTSSPGITYIAKVRSLDPFIAQPFHSNRLPREFDNQSQIIFEEFHTDKLNVLSIQATQVGYATIEMVVFATDSNYSWFLEYEDIGALDTMETVGRLEYHVTAKRRVRLFDVIFDCVVASIATLNSFSMGCTSDWPSVRAHLRHPSSLLIGLTCHFILLPPVSINAMAFFIILLWQIDAQEIWLYCKT